MTFFFKSDSNPCTLDRAMDGDAGGKAQPVPNTGTEFTPRDAIWTFFCEAGASDSVHT